MVRSIRYKFCEIHVDTRPPLGAQDGDFYIHVYADKTATIFLAVDRGLLENLSGATPLSSEDDAINLAKAKIDQWDLERFIEEPSSTFVPEVMALKVRKAVADGSFSLSGKGFTTPISIELLCELHNALPIDSPFRNDLREGLITASKGADDNAGLHGIFTAPDGSLTYREEVVVHAIHRRKANRYAKSALKSLETIERDLNTALGNYVSSESTWRDDHSAPTALVPLPDEPQTIDAVVANLKDLLGKFDSINQIPGILNHLQKESEIQALHIQRSIPFIPVEDPARLLHSSDLCSLVPAAECKKD